MSDDDTQIDAAVAAGGSYELLKQRLQQQGSVLAGKLRGLNEARLAAFGRADLRLTSRLRVRTENNAVARDIVRVGGQLLFGYNVFVGLRQDIKIGDVFGLYQLQDGSDELAPLPLVDSFLAEPRFQADFRELYTYYKQASLSQLRVHQHKLLAAFQIGAHVTDLRVFRWSIEPDGRLKYLDNRGERDIALPPAHDFEWTPTRREDHVLGKHPHINILDTIFVETVGGDLTVKIENNTTTGLGIYSEPVDDKNQSLADADIAYAQLGSLILLRIKPYRERDFRYLVYNHRTQHVVRIDAIGPSCVQLPEDHGIVFPGGYYLQSGEQKQFDLPPSAGLRFKRMVRSPNGEDVLYVFYQPEIGRYALFTYNLIERRLGTPLLSHGYARFDDGRLLVFSSEEGSEATRLHPMQLWQTPFCSDDHAEQQVDRQSFFGRIGNADLVRGIAEGLEIARAVGEQTPTRVTYLDLLRACQRLLDGYFWLNSAEAGQADGEIRAIAATATATLDEFDKVSAIRQEAARILAQREAEQHALLTDLAAQLWQHPDDFVAALDRLRLQRGQLLAQREQRYIDLARLEQMDSQLAAEQTRIGGKALGFLAHEQAFVPYRRSLDAAAAAMATADTTAALDTQATELERVTAALDLLNAQIGNLPGGDAALRTQILEQISSVYAEANRLRAALRQRRSQRAMLEQAAEFGAQFKLLAQAVASALERIATPEQCDDAMTRLLAQLEELEGRFGEQPQFAGDLDLKREEIYEAVSARKQQLLDTRQRRTQMLQASAARILDGVPRRTQQIQQLNEVHAYFAGDVLLTKCRGIIDELRSIGAQVAADDLDTRLKTARDQALRRVRDSAELLTDDGNTIRLGRHAFTVSRQALDLTLLPHDDSLVFHLTGTDYQAPLQDTDAAALRDFWQATLISESPLLSRAEYLAGEVLAQAADPAALRAECSSVEGREQVLARVRDLAAQRYQEGYQKGVHDHDATQILLAVIERQDAARLLAYSPAARILAMLFWLQGVDYTLRPHWQRQAASAAQIQHLFGADAMRRRLQQQWLPALAAFAQRERLVELLPPVSVPWQAAALSAACHEEAAAYLVAELGAESWQAAGAALDLAADFTRRLERGQHLAAWREQLAAGSAVERWRLAHDWLQAYCASHDTAAAPFAAEAAATLVLDLPFQRHHADLSVVLDGLRGEHPQIVDGRLTLRLDDFQWRSRAHRLGYVPGFQQWQSRRQMLLAAEKARLQLAQFQAQPLSSFVRNQLINDVYLPLIGDNLAKQIGSADAGKRTDRMGMLLLISPPGYGKTTLMEYIADRLGLIFVRINAPALGHDVVSLDPAQAPHSAARQELEKLNLGLAMGNNVMLYLDDIQHTHAEFLQKFIALCDGTRRIEGVWRGQPRTYDLRGKRFAMVMAGNPYTESGAAFKIPDMLANRADIYNLGDVLSGHDALFALSYLENSLTANAVLQPLALRDPQDVTRLVRLAQGEEVAPGEFSHPYSAAELAEISGLLQRLFTVRDVLLRVNQAYIQSAAQDDRYRTAPPFKLQGSYRNMTKLAAKVTPIMDAAELDALLRDHYRGEAQTLTAGAEENLLQLAQLIGSPTTEEQTRWNRICDEYRRQQKLGGGSDGTAQVANLLADIGVSLDALRRQLAEPLPGTPDWPQQLEALRQALAALQPQVTVDVPESPALTQLVNRLADTLEKGISPLVGATYHKLKLDHDMWDRLRDMAADMKRLDAALKHGKPRGEA